MSNMKSVKEFFGNSYTDIKNAMLTSQKYKYASLNELLDQKFHVQDNKVQMIVDQSLSGYQIIVNGNEISVSPDLYNHPSIVILNSIEQGIHENSRKLYKKETFSTISYIACQNYTLFQIGVSIKETITIKYRSEYEAFYNSILLFVADKGISLNIVEEYESRCALNNVVNYILNDNSSVNLRTYYKNHLSAQSYCLRTIIAMDSSKFDHVLFGQGSSKVLDECKIVCSKNSKINLKGKIHSDNGEFHSIIHLFGDANITHDISIDFRIVIQNNSTVTVTPITDVDESTISNFNITNLNCDNNSNFVINELSNDKLYVEETLSFDDKIKNLASRKISKRNKIEFLKRELFNF